MIQADESIDFIQFCEQFIIELKEVGRSKSAANFNTVKNSLVDFFNRKQVFVDEINVDMLSDWEHYLRKERTITRLNQFNVPITTIQKPLQMTIYYPNAG